MSFTMTVELYFLFTFYNSELSKKILKQLIKHTQRKRNATESTVSS